MPKQYTPNDPYFYKAKKEGYRARSAFKLLELQERFKIMRRGEIVLDLGACPGSFIQVAVKVVGETGKVIGVDIERIEPFKEKNIVTFECDIFEQEKLACQLKDLHIVQVDTIISDIAPKTSGIKDVDQWKSVELNLEILKVADTFLSRGGNILMKVFIGEDLPELLSATKKRFERVKQYKPKACRDRSFEEYIIGFNKL